MDSPSGPDRPSPQPAERSTSGPDPHRQRLGSTLRDLRRDRGLTLRDVAGALGVSQATLSAVENGRTGVSSARLVRLAEVLEVPVEHLLGSTPAPGDGRSGRPTERLRVDVVHAPVEVTTGTGRHRGVVSGDLPGDDWRAFPPLVLDPSLAAALESFVEFGYHGATVRVVAERAGLSVPGLYHHWAGKQDLLVALLDLTMDDLTARVDAALAQAAAEGPQRRLAAVVECLALFHTHRRELAFVGASEMRGLEPAARERVAGTRRRVQRAVDEQVLAGVEEGVFATPRPQEAARAVVSMCVAMAQWFRADGPDTAEAITAQYVGFALDLVRASR